MQQAVVHLGVRQIRPPNAALAQGAPQRLRGPAQQATGRAGQQQTARFRQRDQLARVFDPHRQRPPNMHTPVSLRDVGGLGIHLLKSLTDRLDYRYRDGHHCLDFEKCYPS